MTERNDIQGRRSRLPTEPATTHAGLWHDVFPPVLRPKKMVGEAALHLRQVCGCPIPEGYPRAFGERKELLSAQRGDIEGSVTWLYEAEVVGRMIVGLGAGSVLEHQVRLQHTWGVPEIPGSGLKGLASSTAHRYGSDRWKKALEVDGAKTPIGADQQSLFGDTTHGGLVIFHDAWWIPEGSKLPLDLDVMTVHQRDYYRDPHNHPPSDTEEPNPVSFLTARGKYLVALTGPETWARCAAEWLQLGLEREGVGAKTRAGYGRMKLVRQLSEQERRREQLAQDLQLLPQQYNGPGTRDAIVKKIVQAQQLGVSPTVLQQVCEELLRKDLETWKRWLKESERSNLERQLFDRRPTTPTSGEQLPPPSTKGDWRTGKAWIARDTKNKEMVFVMADGSLMTRELRLLDQREALRSALGTNEATATPIDFQSKGSGKLLDVRVRSSS